MISLIPNNKPEDGLYNVYYPYTYDGVNWSVQKYLGLGWHVPSEADFQELYDNTDIDIEVHRDDQDRYYAGGWQMMSLNDWGFESEQYYFRTYEGKGKCDSNGYREGTGTLPGHWGLFGWVGMSSTAFTGSPEIYGVSTSITASDYGNIKTELIKSDWGRNIGDGNTWRTLSKDEWLYLFHDSKKFGFATVGGVPGIIILPDSFTDPKTNKGSKAFVSQTTGWTANEFAAGGNWDAMENAGAVFLPAAGYREGTDDTKVGSVGFYWSSSPFEYRADNAY